MLPRSLLSCATIFAAVVFGQTQTQTKHQTSQPSSTSSTAIPTVSIAVGANGFVFTPDDISNVSIGSILEFNIYPGGHAVARSDFKQPCIPYALTGANRVGFWSGWISPQVVSDDLPKYSVRVNDTDPIFFYCTAPTSCLDHHMIGVVNPNANETLDLQLQYLSNATLMLVPGENFPTEGASSTLATSTATATSTSAAATSTSSSSPSGGASNSPSLNAGQIAGVAIGGAALLLLAAALIYLCGRRGGLDKAYRRSGHMYPPPQMVEAHYGNPKSPAQGTSSTNHYSLPPEQETYGSRAQSPRQNLYAAQTSPPLSPHHTGYNTYQSTLLTSVHSPLVGDGVQQGYYMPVRGTPEPDQLDIQQQQLRQMAPVELPTSRDPGHSPLPTYQGVLSWQHGPEGYYQPVKPADVPPVQE